MKRGLLLSVLLSGCALLSKGELANRRFFSPPVVRGATAAAPSGRELRLGRVTAGACGSERMMVRYSTEEVGFHDERLWTEKPEVYLRRAVQLELFEVNGPSSVVRGAGLRTLGRRGARDRADRLAGRGPAPPVRRPARRGARRRDRRAHLRHLDARRHRRGVAGGVLRPGGLPGPGAGGDRGRPGSRGAGHPGRAPGA